MSKLEIRAGVHTSQAEGASALDIRGNANYAVLSTDHADLRIGASVGSFSLLVPRERSNTFFTLHPQSEALTIKGLTAQGTLEARFFLWRAHKREDVEGAAAFLSGLGSVGGAMLGDDRIGPIAEAGGMLGVTGDAGGLPIVISLFGGKQWFDIPEAKASSSNFLFGATVGIQL